LEQEQGLFGSHRAHLQPSFGFGIREIPFILGDQASLAPLMRQVYFRFISHNANFAGSPVGID
jgi:hypothetical protein